MQKRRFFSSRKCRSAALRHKAGSITPQKIHNFEPPFPENGKEGVRVNDPSADELKQIQTPRAWNKEKYGMKNLNSSNQRSFSFWGMKAGSRAVIATVAIVALAALLGSPSGQAQGGAVAPQIEGSWLVTVTIPDGPPPFKGLGTYSAGGGLVVTDGGTPPAAGNVYQGTWRRNGGHKIAFTFLGLNYDSTGVLVGIFRVQEHLEIEPSGNAYNGVWTGEVLDLNGNVIESGFGGTTHATRINAE